VTTVDPRASVVPEAPSVVPETSANWPLAGVQWGAIVAGAVGAAALGFVLDSFAAAIGLSVSSTAPTWRDTSFALVLLSGLYLLLAAIVAYGFGGYLAGRLRLRSATHVAAEVEFRDGIHGLLAWALATLIIALIAVAAAPSLSRLAAPPSSSAGSSTSVTGENLIADDLDRLFRGERQAAGDINYARAEAARILLTTASHRGLQSDDKAYLVRLVAARTGLSAADAEKRVDEVIARASDNIRRARRTAVVLAFIAGAAALAGAAMAWFAGVAGGEHRDGRSAPHFLFEWVPSARRA
jgi:hypothetical protein